MIIVLALLVAVSGYAEEQREPLDIFDMNGKLLVHLGCTAKDVVDNMGAPDNMYSPYIEYDNSKLSPPEIEKPEMDQMGKSLDVWKALLDAVPNDWDVMDVASAEMAIEPFGIKMDDLPDVLGASYISRDDIERGFVKHSTIEDGLGLSERWVELYNDSMETYNKRISYPYEEWIEEVGSSLTVTEGMLRMMVNVGDVGRGVIYGLRYNGLSVSVQNDSSALLEKGPHQSLFEYLNEKLTGQEYDSVEARNAAIAEETERYCTMRSEWTDQVLAGSTVTGVFITKMGYQTGNGEYIGQPYEVEGTGWGVTNYYSGTLPLSYDYIRGLSEEEKAEIEGLASCSIRLEDKKYISQISIEKYIPRTAPAATPEPIEEEAQQSPEEAFIDDLLHGFTERDRLISKAYESESYYATHYVEIYTGYVLAEKEYVEKYKEIEFADDTVKEAAWLYNDGLDNQYKAITEYGETDSELYDKYWSDGYYERCRALYLLSEKYDLKVIITAQEALDEMIATGADVEVTITTNSDGTEG